MRKLWLHPRPRTMWGRGRWKGTWPWMLLCFASNIAVWRLSRELDFMRPRVGPSAPPAEGSGKQTETRLEDLWGPRWPREGKRPGWWKRMSFCSETSTRVQCDDIHVKVPLGHYNHKLVETFTLIMFLKAEHITSFWKDAKELNWRFLVNNEEIVQNFPRHFPFVGPRVKAMH